MTGQLLTPGDVAERCQLSTKTVLRAIQAGRLRASRLGTHTAYRIREEDLDAWVATSALPADPPPPAAVELPPPRVLERGRLALTSEMGRR